MAWIDYHQHLVHGHNTQFEYTCKHIYGPRTLFSIQIPCILGWRKEDDHSIPGVSNMLAATEAVVELISVQMYRQMHWQAAQYRMHRTMKT